MSHVRARLAVFAIVAASCHASPSGGATGAAATDDTGVSATSSSGGAQHGSSDGSNATTATPGSSSGVVDGSETTLGPFDPPVLFDVATPMIDVGAIGPVECECAPHTDRIHVVTTDGQLWAFDPLALEFELVADLGLLGGCATPVVFSMSVARSGEAWLQFTDGTLHTLDINAPVGCMATGFVPPPALQIGNFGMGFVVPQREGGCDTLFGHRVSFGVDGPGVGLLFAIDPETVMVIDSQPTDFTQAELSGTGDGRLFGFAGSSPAKLVEFDPQDGSAISVLDLDGLELTSAFAFAAWGGDFYFFTVSDTDFSRSEVNHLDYDDSDANGVQDLTELLDVVPFVGTISGAGVSTCAPTEPPPA